MAAEAKKVWIGPATQLDSQGQVVGGGTLQFEILSDHLATLTLRIAATGVQIALDLEKLNGAVWDPVGSLSVLGEESFLATGVYRASCHLYGGTPNESGTWEGETTFTLLPYEDLDS